MHVLASDMTDMKTLPHTTRPGYFGSFGGRYVPETLMPPLLELEECYERIMSSSDFRRRLHELLSRYCGRPTPVTFCENLSADLGFELYLKREDLLHTGAHKINNAIGQTLLAHLMGKTHVIAETGAGQHGVATATAAAKFGMRCTIFMGAKDVERQAPNVQRMRLLGAEVVAVKNGSCTLKDAINDALRYWIAHQDDTLYVFGTAAGPHPFPTIVRELQSVIGRESVAQMREMTGALPDCVVACVGGGSNAIGMLHPFVPFDEVRLVGVEAGGTGEPGCEHSAAINLGRPGVLHGVRTMLLQDEDGQIMESSSISAGLDYPGVGPEHVWLHSIGRVHYGLAYDHEALNAFLTLSRREGIIPALESSHALAWVLEHREEIAPGSRVLVNLSGRGDKDLDHVLHYIHLD